VTDKPCPFCNVAADRIVTESNPALAVRDGFPVSQGHTLVVPRRHVGSLYDCTPNEQEAV
jgi:diadenosine tetraphosphate (Ap4A) HIT family hydrolase